MALRDLQLLVKLSGSFALGGVVCSNFCSAPADDEFPASLLSLLLPKKAHAYTLARVKAPLPRQKASQTFYVLDEDGRYRKVRQIGDVRLTTLSTTRTLRFSTPECACKGVRSQDKKYY